MQLNLFREKILSPIEQLYSWQIELGNKFFSSSEGKLNYRLFEKNKICLHSGILARKKIYHLDNLPINDPENYFVIPSSGEFNSLSEHERNINSSLRFNLPTPKFNDRAGHNPNTWKKGSSKHLAHCTNKGKGKLSPEFVEAMMGFPPHWTFVGDN